MTIATDTDEDAIERALTEAGWRIAERNARFVMHT